MILKSITSKLLSLIITVCLITYICILLVADKHITEVIDQSQDAVYAEKMGVIYSALSKANERLQMTGMVEAYSKDFKRNVIASLKETYYSEQNPTVYPFILNIDNTIVMQPLLGSDDNFLQLLEDSNELFSEDSGDFVFTNSGKKRWYIYKKFAPWGWIICYTVPLDIKYASARKSHNILILILSIGTTVMLIVLAFVITKLTKPILTLTKITTEIAKGNLEEKIDLDTGDEVGTLARSFDIMRSAIRQQISDLNVEVFERKEAEKKLRVTLNSIGDAVIATDINGRITRMNPIAEKLCGYSFEEVNGRRLVDIYNIVNALTRKPQVNPIEKVLKTGEIVELTNHKILISNDSSECQISDSAAPIKNDDGVIIGVVLVFRDVSNEYALQEQLRQSQKMDAIGQLAGGIAHDFNNILGGIIGAAELIEMCPDGDPKYRQYNKMILEAADRATELIKKILAFARKQKIGSSEINVHDTLLETISLLENTIDRRIKIEYEFTAEERVILGDISQLQAIFLNLGINSSHAMPEGGLIHIFTSVIELDSAYCKSSLFNIKPGKYIEIKFSDTGYGINVQDLQHIFEPFFTTKLDGKGTGLGLAVVYGAVQQHQGAISVHSEVGVGTVFHIFLPLTINDTKYPSSEEPQLVSGCGKILVVDDELIMRKTASAILENLGYNVVVAENGKEGLEIFANNHNDIDLVLLDMIMPVMNGSDCFKALKEIDSDVRVVLASGFTRDEDVEGMKKAGLCGYIRKPYKSTDLSKIIQSILSC